jgi:hypothetical protein
MHKASDAELAEVVGVTERHPYSPSWVDRLTAWVSRLPGPAWLYYLAVALALAVFRTILAWIDGSYPVGTIFPLHILDQFNILYPLFVLHLVDDHASSSLAASRSVLTVSDAGYDKLRYELTTMPARPALAWGFAGLLFGLIYLPLIVPPSQRQLLQLFTSPTAVVVDVALSALNWIFYAIFAYHTFRQLGMVSRIYTHHMDVNVFEIGPLYALSRVTAITSIALLFITYLYVTYWGNWQIQTPADIVIVLAFVLVAAAAFVWPLLGAHRLLQEEKERRKGEVARRMESITDELHRRVDARDLQQVENLKHALDGLIAERGVIDKMPTWPWHPDAVRAVVTALFLPIVLWLITRVLERLGL